MKKITCMAMMAVALLLATPAQAQFSWGIKGGVNLVNNDLSALKGMNKEQVMNKDSYTGFFIGPKAELRIPLLGFGVEVAALYSQKGMEFSEGEIFKQNSFQIPLNLKYAFGLGNIANVFIAAGPEFGFNVGETTKVFNNIKLNEINNQTTGNVQAYVLEKSTLSINVGVGATLLNHLQVGINYNIPWGKTADFTTIDASELENVENIKNGQNISAGAFEKLSGTVDKAKQASANIKSATLQVSVAYLF
ncbi:MAG: PorT family protein [Bacteroidaceae bacterium]|nr:PorT family protein [Bacteroidaceae bacterium]